MPRYRNLDGKFEPKTLVDVFKWKAGLGPEKKRRAPSRAPVPVVENDGRALQGAQRPAVTWVGHATFLVQLGGLSVLTDPVLSERIAVTIPRNVRPGLSYEALPKVDAVVLTHNHYDHMDAPTLQRLGPAVRYFVPEGLGSWFRKNGLPQVTELRWWQQAQLGALSLTFVPAQHWSRRSLSDTNETLWGGFVLEGGGRRVYHSGDTAWFEGFRDIGARCGPVDAALLPIGAYDPRWFMRAQHMNPEDAVEAFLALGARRFVAMHWGTFKLTDEPLDEPPQLLRRLWAERGLPPAQLAIPAIGETLWL
jgi:L-ascorbate metabolism protein UlaG (beta-lactamase superfamily)